MEGRELNVHMSWGDIHDLIAREWWTRTAANQMTAGSAARYTRVFASFCKYATAHHILTPEEVDARLVSAFTIAPLPGRRAPSTSTSRFRLTVVRTGMRVLLELGLIAHDPTVGLRVAQVPPLSGPFPLTPPEVQRLRTAGRLSPRDTLRPVIVELGLLGGSHLDIAHAVVSDFDAPQQEVALGTPGRARRHIGIDDHAAHAISRRIESQRRDYRRKHIAWATNDVPLALTRPLEDYPVETIAPSISSSISRAMAHAGVNRSGVRPRSVREFAANRIYAKTGDIQAVALLLGVSSLDSAMRFIDLTWQSEWGEQVKAHG